MRRFVAAVALLVASAPALAVQQFSDFTIQVPEPGILELAAVAAVVGWIVGKRRK